MRFHVQKDSRGWLLRYWNKNHVEAAYAVVGLRGVEANIEFPSDWHEHARTWINLGFGLFSICFSFPYKGKLVPDDGQCSGPRYGFAFHNDILWIYHGKSTSKPNDGSRTMFDMPWHWNFKEHEVLSDKETHDYLYWLKNGLMQERKAEIQAERWLWTRYWLPWKKERKCINIEFSDEVGERTGSWKGGCTGCSYDMKPNEIPLQALRRMERERRFDR